MQKFHFSGIQQMGIGNPDVHKTWAWYRKNFDFDTPIFEEEAEAALMLPYTNNEVHTRNAALVLNMNGGGGLEIWQYKTRDLIWPSFEVLPGDLGIHTLKIKTLDITKAYADCKSKGLNPLCEIQERNGKPYSFLLKDLHGNMVEICQSESWFQKDKSLYGGVGGAAIGVSDMNKALTFYKEVLGFDKFVWEEKGAFDDLNAWAGEKHLYHRVILERSAAYKGPFSPLLGPAQLELVYVDDRKQNKIFEGRFWGDPGYIHLCFDIVGMEALKKHCESKGHPFTVDSANSFDMGEAAGRFVYIEDPDGTWIEFVETHKIPLIKKIGWYLNLQKRNPEKPLPRWMLKALGLSKVKD